MTRPLFRSVLLSLGAALLIAPAALGAGAEQPAGPPRTPATRFIPGRVIVEWESGVSSAERVSARADADTTLVRTLGAPRFQLVNTEPGQSVADALATLRADPNVKVAERDGWDALNSVPNDPLFNQLWGLQNTGAGIGGFAGAVAGADIGAPAAWDRTVGSPSIVIADLDTGYRFSDGDLGPVAWTNPGETANGADDDGDGIVDDLHGADFVGSNADAPATDGDPTDDNIVSGGHGLHTAGTMGAAGNNGVGIAGVAQNVRIMPLRVCANSPSASNDGRCPFSSQVAAINYAGAKGARAANMSLGGTTVNTAVRDAIASNPQTLFVISAGNDAQNNDPGFTPHYPCAYTPQTTGIPGAIDNIVCVAATDQADHLASFSDWGAASVDLGAPGTETLSTYLATEDRFTDDFSNAGTFATNWTTTGANGGFSRANAGPDGSPLSSFGMVVSTGPSPTANQTFETTSANIPIPAGYGSCSLTQTRTVATDANDSYQYFVLSNGSPVFTSSSSISSSGTFFTTPITGLASTNVQVRFRFTTGASPAANKGVALDDIKVNCFKPTSAPLIYHLLEGTSMAAPHVTGAAGLLFSLKPSATVTEVRNALLTSTTPDPALVGKTTTGGRLNLPHAMSVLVPPNTAITSAPGSSTTSTSATFAFKRADAPIAATFECSLDGAGFAACANPAHYTVGLGHHSFAVRARDAFGALDASPATAAWTVSPVVVAPKCVVPKLKGKSLKQAKKALANAHCALGKVTKPRKRKHHKLPPLVVKSTSPKAGTSHAAGTKVALTLKAKPKPKKHKHRH